MRHALIGITVAALAVATWAAPAASTLPSSTAAPAASTSKPSEPLAVLLEKGIYQEETAGNLDAAMKIYSQIIEQSAANRQAVAQAHYRLGMCLLKKGDKTQAAQQFDQVAQHFSDQKDIAAKAQAELAKMPKASNQPHVVKTMPAALADDVDPALNKITVTFDQPMMDKSWSFTSGDKAFSEQTGSIFPESAGEISYGAARTTCTMPVKLQPGKVYWVGINSPSHQNFQTVAHVPAGRYIIVFATKSADGKPTPIPADLLEQAKQINAAPPESVTASGGRTNNAPHVVKTTPPNLTDDVDPSVDKITVTFDQQMLDGCWSWTGAAFSPEGAGRPYYDRTRTTCTLPVKLEPGKIYRKGINSPSHQNFQNESRVPAVRYVVLFATRSADGKPTPIPADLLEDARQVNAAGAESFDGPVQRGGVKDWVEKFFSENYRDVTARKTLAWGQPMEDANGNVSITYKYLATIWDKDKKVIEQRFTFTPQGKYVSAETIETGPATSQPASGQDANAAAAVKAAVPVAQEWMKLVDDGKYAESWDAAAEFLRKAVTKDAFQQQLQGVRSPLGKVLSRKLLTAVFSTSLPGAPDGQYVVMQFQTSFENKKEAVETVTPTKDSDGKWRVAGYYIK